MHSPPEYSGHTRSEEDKRRLTKGHEDLAPGCRLLAWQSGADQRTADREEEEADESSSTESPWKAYCQFLSTSLALTDLSDQLVERYRPDRAPETGAGAHNGHGQRTAAAEPLPWDCYCWVEDERTANAKEDALRQHELVVLCAHCC